MNDTEMAMWQLERARAGISGVWLTGTSIDELGAMLIYVRRLRDLTQEQLGDLVGASRHQVRRWERTRYARVNKEMISKVMGALGLTFQYTLAFAESDENLFSRPSVDGVAQDTPVGIESA